MLPKYLAAAGATVCFVLAIAAQRHADLAKPPAAKSQLLYLPNEKLLNHFTAGMSSVIADLLWLDCVQYVASEVKSDRDFRWLNQMLDTVTRLDPYFVDAYRYGGMFLAALKADDNAGLELIERGMIRNPRAWELPYEAAMMYLLNRGQQPEAKRAAALYLSMSAATGNAPQHITDLAVALQSQYDLADIERQMWRDLLASNDSLLRDVAARKLVELDLRAVLLDLNKRTELYKDRTGQMPRNLEDLVEAGFIIRVPEDPLGGRFFVDKDGVVQNSSLLDDLERQRRESIERAIARFEQKYQEHPQSLNDLLYFGLLKQIPSHPYDRDWRYDPASGLLLPDAPRL